MSAAATAEATTQQFKCSCGRTFVHELSLKRHRWVTGHTEEESTEGAAAVAAPVETAAPALEVDRAANAYEQAIEVLRLKRLEQEQFEAYQQMDSTVDAVTDALEAAGETLYNGVVQAGQAARATAASGLAVTATLIRVLLVMVMMLGLVSAGVGVGKMVASSTGTGMSQVSMWTVSQN